MTGEDKKYDKEDILKLLETHLGLPPNAAREKFIDGKPNTLYAKRTAQIHILQIVNNIKFGTEPAAEPYTLPEGLTEETITSHATFMANLLQLGINKSILDSRFDAHAISFVHHDLAKLAGKSIPQPLKEKTFRVDDKVIPFADIVNEARMAKGLIEPITPITETQNPQTRKFDVEAICTFLERHLQIDKTIAPTDLNENSPQWSKVCAELYIIEALGPYAEKHENNLPPEVDDQKITASALSITNFLQLARNKGLSHFVLPDLGAALARALLIPGKEAELEAVKSTNLSATEPDGTQINLGAIWEEVKDKTDFVPFVTTVKEPTPVQTDTTEQQPRAATTNQTAEKLEGENDKGLLTGTNMTLAGGIATAIGGAILTTSNRREMEQAMQNGGNPPRPEKSWVERVCSLEGVLIAGGVLAAGVAAYKKWGGRSH